MAEPYVNPAELPVKRRENIALGVLGALLFSAAGGLVHFGLLQLGYIAWISALVGMAAGYFGYGLFSGRKNTVHGAILAVVFTMLMIVAAEYFGLAKEIFDALKETYDIAFRDALASVPDFLTEAEIRTSVLKDLGIAFVFSILEAVFFIRDAVRRDRSCRKEPRRVLIPDLSKEPPTEGGSLPIRKASLSPMGRRALPFECSAGLLTRRKAKRKTCMRQAPLRSRRNGRKIWTISATALNRAGRRH